MTQVHRCGINTPHCKIPGKLPGRWDCMRLGNVTNNKPFVNAACREYNIYDKTEAINGIGC